MSWRDLRLDSVERVREIKFLLRDFESQLFFKMFRKVLD